MARRMHRSACPLARVFSASLAALVLVVVLAPTARAATVRYVALGDSYSSGVGAGDYVPASGDCLRSNNAYPRLWARQQDAVSITFNACSGATIADVRANQLDALDSETTLVTISAGGNDAEFADVMTTCVAGSESTCADEVERAEKFIRAELPGRLDELYAALREQAPNARIVVVGYPRIYELSGSCWVGLSESKRAAVNSGADALAEVIADRAAHAGVAFVDAREEFIGHEICSGDRWLHSVNWANIAESYHPTAEGQADGYLPALVGVTGSRVSSRGAGQ